ncbi:hypothetical protein [Halomicrobium urmianum]|uniref:hypothetical protein n=1 Tax=Halomicrobium urmianum TaxID=1586233 RepID=UPI001CD946FE|nr:hypothetical protein [Halomicrobium urmianum]
MSADGSLSRPSKNNRQAPRESLSRQDEGTEPSDLPDGTPLRPISVEAGRQLRDEAVMELTDGMRARPWYSVVDEWRDWYESYLNSHIEFEGPDGETVRTELENSYMPKYGRRYYGKLKDLERGIERECESLTTVMLTFTASNRNAEGGYRCPADHMRDIMDGYDAARKQVHQVLSGLNWEYARVWEPHKSGYGHLHMAIFVEADDLDAERFRPVMDSHVRNCDPAGSEAHTLENAVSVNNDVNNLGTYISEYIGIFGEQPTERPMTEQMFYAVAWATNTRRVDFSNGAHDLMAREQFRRETGLRPEERGGEAFDEWRGTDGTGSDWSVDSICSVPGRHPDYADPTTGGVDTAVIDGRAGVDPPPTVE